MKENRRYERIEAALEVRVHWPEKGREVTTTLNFSDGGALVKNPFGEVPPVGTPLTLQLTTLVLGKEPPLLEARVVRACISDIACQFTAVP